MRKTIIALVAFTMIASAIMPIVTSANTVGPNEGWEVSMNTDADIVLGGSNNAPGPTPPGSPQVDPPVIEYAWVWPDADTSTSGTQILCTASGTTSGIKVKIIVSDPNGLGDIEDIKVQIVYPNIWPWCMCPKFKISAIQETDCAVVEAQALEAKQAGLITGEEYDEIIYEVCEQFHWGMYIATFSMYYCEPAGHYDVWIWGIDKAFQIGSVYKIGTDLSGSGGFGFEFVELLVMDYDFSSLNYGNIRPCVVKYIQGDEDLLTPAHPTVKNEGNVPIEIHIKNDPMIMANTQYEITKFDWRFKDDDDTYNADEWETIDPILCICNTEKLDLSIHADEFLPQGHYDGKFYMQIYKGGWGGSC